MSGCRPYLSIDSTHLNGKWNGHLAAVTALDGHNWMFPVAFGFFDAETTENWTWFMSQLKKAIGNPPILAICTDACKGLENAVKTVFPNAEQRECFRHLMGNAVKKFHGEKFSHMWPAAKAYKKSKFDWHMKQVFMEEPKVYTYLELYHNLLWMRCMFNTRIKVDYIHNNLAECFNSWVRHIKDLPIVQLCDKLREMVMELLRKRRRIGERLQGKILPAIIQELNNRTRGLGHLKTHVSSDLSAEVRDTEKEHIRHVVKALTCECTCLEWQHTGKPCPHALVVLTALPNVKLEDFVDDYYSVEKFKAAYQGEIEPLTDKTQWPAVDLGFVLHAPLPKRGAGRHRKLRIKGALEGGSGNKPKVGGLNQCKKCHELGHREAGCTYNGAKKRNRRRNEAPWEDGSTSTGAETSSPTTMFPISPAKTPKNVSPCSPGPVKTSHTTMSPGPVTRSQTAMSPRPVTRSQAAMSPAMTPVKSPPKSVQEPPKKLTPKRRKLNM